MKILAGTFPLSADPGKVFFIILILKQTSRYRRRQRVGTSRYAHDLNWVPPAIVFFAAEIPWFNLGAYWVVKPLKCVFCYLKGRGPLKTVKNLRKCRRILGPLIDTTHTPPLFSFYTTFNWLPLWKNLNVATSEKNPINRYRTEYNIVFRDFKFKTVCNAELWTYDQRVHHFVVGCCCWI